MKYLSLWQVLIFFIVLNFISGVWANNNVEHDLVLTIHCPQRNIKQGDEIPIVFTITNNGSSAHSFEKRNYDRSGRIWEYELVAKYQDGMKVPDPRENYEEGIGGGLGGGERRIGPGHSYSRTITLNQWALINKPDRYSVIGIYSYSIRDTDAYNKYGTYRSRTIRVKSAPIEIVVKSRGHWRMGWHIKSLIKKLKKIKPSRKQEVVQQKTAIIAKLAYTCDNRIIPTLLDLMYRNYHNNEVSMAQRAFFYLPKDIQTKKMLINKAMTRGMAPGMQFVLKMFDCSKDEFRDIIAVNINSENVDFRNEAIMAAQEYPDDLHMPHLISIALDNSRVEPDHPSAAIERHRAIYAISHNRTDEGVKALKTLLDDSKKGICRTTQDAIRNAYQRHPTYPEISDDEKTAALIPTATDFNDPMHIPAIIRICRSRTEEGVEALKILTEDPERDIVIARTDAGVKTIRDLLRSQEDDISKLTSDIVKSIYREYPGRPLRNDDFPEEFRENSEKRKKNRLEQIMNM